MKSKALKIAIVLFLYIVSPILISAQALTGPLQPLPDQKLASKLMGRDMPYRVILPAGYAKNSQLRYPVIYLLHGLSGHFDNWTDKTKLTFYAAAYDFVIVTPEGNDGWYTDSATVPNDKYESYIVDELIPAIDKKFRTQADRDHRIIAGLSMGGYGSVKFGLKYPNLFSIVGSFSGAFDAPMRTVKSGNNWPSIPSVFGPEDSKKRPENNIFDLLRGFDPSRLSSIPFIYFACGTEDPIEMSTRSCSKRKSHTNIASCLENTPGIFGISRWKNF